MRVIVSLSKLNFPILSRSDNLDNLPVCKLNRLSRGRLDNLSCRGAAEGSRTRRNHLKMCALFHS